MRREFSMFLAIALIGVPLVAQMRSSVTAGGAPSPQHSAVFMRPGAGYHHNFARRNNFGTLLYPYGFYDSFYDERPNEVEQPAPVVVIREERPPAATAPSAPTVVADPKIIEVPSAPARSVTATNLPTTAIFILSDGRRLEAQSYTISDSQLTLKEAHKPAVQIQLTDLNVEATLAANRERGLDLRLPEGRSEFLISF